MRHAAMAAAVLVVGLALAAPAFTTTHRNQAPQPPGLQAQVNALKKQVKKLQAQMALKDASAVRTTILASLIYSACLTAATADALQGSRPDQFGTTPVNDYTTCSRLPITRSPNQATTAVFQSLLDFYK